MKRDDQRALFDALLAATGSGEMRNILVGLGDSDAATLNTPFGKHRLVWRPFGGKESNLSTIGLGTKPGRSLTERITNAIDAILEERITAGVNPPISPRRAANAWFGRPVSGPDAGLFSWRDMPDDFDKHIHVVLRQSDREDRPTIDVVDDGIGIEGRDFPQTILSLQGGNKIRKRHLIGAFGQGGAATLDFSDYTLIFSRSKANPKMVAFTVVRVLKLDASYKEDSYAYLGIDEDADGGGHVFSVQLAGRPIELYAEKVPDVVRGTLVRHVNYRLTNLTNRLQASPGNLYHYLHFSMFDPLVPFRLVDLRGEEPRNEYIGGARNRLMDRTRQAARTRKAQEQGIDEDEKSMQIRHYRPMEFVVPSGSMEASIGIEYWVVFSYKKRKDEEPELRSHSNELFVQHGYPIIGTLNGQNQGESTGQLLKQLGLSLLSRHIVIHIDATNADSTIRRGLFSTSREGFKDGPVLEGLLAMLRRILQDDEKLAEIERELTARITQKEADSAKSEVKKEVVRLLREAGFAVKEQGRVDVTGQGQKHVVERPAGPRPLVHDPLATLPYPEVTRFEIVYPEDLFQVPLNDTQAVIVETDADAAYEPHIHIRSEPPILEVATHAPLRGGRARWRLRPVAGASLGQSGEVIASLTKPDGSQIVSKVLFEILAPREKKAKEATGQVPPFDIRPVHPGQTELWNALWPEDGDDAETQRKHAYKVLQSGDTVNVYYSTVFTPFAEATAKLKAIRLSRLPIFETSYEIWIGYHAILQHESAIQESSGVTEVLLEQIQEAERQTVGRVQVRQAWRIAELVEQKAVHMEVRA
jgi:hypothetical protein